MAPSANDLLSHAMLPPQVMHVSVGYVRGDWGSGKHTWRMAPAATLMKQGKKGRTRDFRDPLMEHPVARPRSASGHTVRRLTNRKLKRFLGLPW